MKGLKQKILRKSDSCPLAPETESTGYAGVPTCIGIAENNLSEVQFTSVGLLERILSSGNLNAAYRRVVSNGGSSGVDGLEVGDLLDYLKVHKEDLLSSLYSGSYQPSPVKRVEIPKDNGGKRELGIPTVVDRLIQQAIAQVLSVIYEQQFCADSYGFRPKRDAHMALRAAQNYVNSGYKYVVDLDLERFFDTVNHCHLLELLSRTIKDGRVISLIHWYLRCGVVIGNIYCKTESGTPQGGPLSPLLSNIVLHELDKELVSRGHPFVRYGDDSLIFCQSQRAASRTALSITGFIESRLHLKVNTAKTKVGYVRGMKFLGHSFYVREGQCRLCVHSRSYVKLISRLKELTGRSNGMGYEKRKSELHVYIRGWVQYFRYADMNSRLRDIDGWLRRRLRMCIWKSWKLIRTRLVNLMRCGISRHQAWQWANSSSGYWRIAGSGILNRAINNDRLDHAGYPSLQGYYRKIVS